MIEGIVLGIILTLGVAVLPPCGKWKWPEPMRRRPENKE